MTNGTIGVKYICPECGSGSIKNLTNYWMCRDCYHSDQLDKFKTITWEYRKPKIGKKIWVLVEPFRGEPSKMICTETVGWLGSETFIVENYHQYDEGAEYRYDDYNRIWFTSLAAAKAKLKELNPGCKLQQNEYLPDNIWEVVE